MRRLIIFGALLAIIIVPGCGKKEAVQNSDMPNINVSSSIHDDSKSGKEKNNNSKNNSEKVFDVLQQANKELKFYDAPDFARMMLKCREKYKDDIVNPSNNDTDCYIQNVPEGRANMKEFEMPGFSVCIYVMDDFDTKLERMKIDEITFACNPASYGLTMAFVFRDGFVIYQVDENGNKKDQIVYYFKDHMDDFKE